MLENAKKKSGSAASATPPFLSGITGSDLRVKALANCAVHGRCHTASAISSLTAYPRSWWGGGRTHLHTCVVAQRQETGLKMAQSAGDWGRSLGGTNHSSSVSGRRALATASCHLQGVNDRSTGFHDICFCCFQVQHVNQRPSVDHLGSK